MNINKSFERIINPIKDFLISEELFKNQEYAKVVYDRIFVEMTLFIKQINKVTLQSCNLSKKHKTLDYIGKINCKTKKHKYEISIIFQKDIVEVIIDDRSLGYSTIFGATIKKDTLSVSNVKIDIATFKQDISEIIK